MKYFILLISFLAFNLQSCVKKKQDCPTKFQISSQVIPYSEDYKIGDTITIISKFHKNVYELNTKNEYNMEDINWRPSLGLYNTDSIDERTNFNKYFDFIPDDRYDFKLDFYSEGSFLIGKYNFQNDSFLLNFMILPKMKGNYYIEFTHADFNDQQDFPGKCNRIGFETYTLMNEGQDNNIHLLNESPDPHYNDWILQKPEERFHKFGGYCFKVVE